MAFSISVLLGLSQFIWSTSSAGAMSGGFWGGGRFSNSSKCSLHLFNCSSTLVSTLPFLSLIGLSVCLYFHANFLVISYSCVMLSWADASSASLAMSSMKFSLSVFTQFLNALSATVCSCMFCWFCCSRSPVVNCTFLFLPHLHFADSVCRNPVFLLVSLLSQNFTGRAGPHLLDLLPLCVYVCFLRQEDLVGLRICFSL
ncbi:hypothetical protein NP493_5g17096 [Ridgeia piscesae]|uniref:Secreted protein n=1 Tax=Ridgeia piscesae TaxID=27915 RepID=A0AAD9ULG5_RIDPI|nr:hypothetical protein NP493_5g17096 [Ridgeia piscesae]